ncbi:uncharacterized protein LOC123498771 [Portunus trituberculatus]|uniref:uncharacterized protein LOC123498771 n=1 Tax=Portunus trituberculatus TaxID=210409 RepID=UPI001E1CB793|nr:uncharacterized protein LOC123498771 [Portunus trituberculatus]
MGVRVVWACWVSLMVVAAAAEDIVKESAERPRRSASADPAPVTNADLAALGGLGGLTGLTGGAGGANPSAAASGPGGVCGNQDLLTNLLVYQYLSGNIPEELLVLPHSYISQHTRGVTPATRTVTSVSKTLTTVNVDVPATTHFSTSTTSYVTTITSVDVKTIPVIFRGSRITTTITESSEEVITATEYFTESSVHQPSIVQTFPVHITITETRTRGLDGAYTLFDLTHGATSVLQEPINTASFNLDTGLDLANLDLSQLDLTSITGGAGGLGGLDGDQGQVLSVLSSLLSGIDDPPADELPSPIGPSSSSSSSRDFRQSPNRNRNQNAAPRFSPDYPDYEDPVDETPKFNVLRGFTLSDRLASVTGGDSPSSGRAATDTRYSKYQRKSRVENNGISTTEASTREAERFSASTRRRTLSRTDRRRSTKGSRPPSTRFVPAPETQYFEDNPTQFRPFGARRDRETSSRRRGNLEPRTSSQPPRARSQPQPKVRQEESAPTPRSKPQPTPASGLSTVLTMYISGSEPGQFFTRLQTIQLRSLGSSRRRRNVNELPVTKLSTSTVSPVASLATLVPRVPVEAEPSNVVKMLKQLEPTQVRQMIHSLQKWVNYYSHEVLDEEPDNLVMPELTSSLSMETQEVESEATKALPRSPMVLTGMPLATDRCPVPSTVTTTVYHTVVLTAGIDINDSIV